MHQMQWTPLETNSKYGVLEVEKTPESGPHPNDPLIVTVMHHSVWPCKHRGDSAVNSKQEFMRPRMQISNHAAESSTGK